jgi:hypothetical protein
MIEVRFPLCQPVQPASGVPSEPTCCRVPSALAVRPKYAIVERTE